MEMLDHVHGSTPNDLAMHELRDPGRIVDDHDGYELAAQLIYWNQLRLPGDEDIALLSRVSRLR